MKLAVHAATHTGKKRPVNEDRYVIRRLRDGSLLIAVADGMGGAPGGEQASALAVSVLAESAPCSIDQEALRGMLMKAHEVILTHAGREHDLGGMGTTLTVAVVGRDSVVWAHVGDCRLYLLRRGGLTALTTDHRFLSSMVRDGDMSPEEARVHPLRHMLDQCLGCPGMEPDTGHFRLRPDDALLLCSDGLYEEVPHASILSVMGRGELLRTRVERLLRMALDNGGKDNVTLIAVE